MNFSGDDRNELELVRRARELIPESYRVEDVTAGLGLANACSRCGFDPQEEDEEKLYDLGWLPTTDGSLGLVCPSCTKSGTKTTD